MTAPYILTVRTAVAAILASDGLDGTLRRYRNLRHGMATAGESDAHDTALACCRRLAQRAYPPAKPRPRPPRPAPAGRPLIDVLGDADS